MTKRLPYLALATAGTLWGTTVPLSKEAVEWAGPAWLTALRFALAAPLLACFARRGLRAAVTPGIVAWGAVGYGLVILLQNAGIARTSATHAAILVGAMPAMVALLCSVLGRAPVRPAAGAGLVAALVGVALVAGGGTGGTDLAGDGLVLASVGVAAVFAIVAPRLLEGRDVVAVTAVQLAAAGCAGTVAALLLEGVPAAPTAVTDVVVLLALVVIGTLVPFTLFAFGQSLVAPQMAGTFVNLEPLVGATVGVIVLGDPFSSSQGVGCAAILIGIALSAWPRTAMEVAGGPGRCDAPSGGFVGASSGTPLREQDWPGKSRGVASCMGVRRRPTGASA